MLRNPKDVSVSFYHMYKQMSREMLALKQDHHSIDYAEKIGIEFETYLQSFLGEAAKEGRGEVV